VLVSTESDDVRFHQSTGRRLHAPGFVFAFIFEPELSGCVPFCPNIGPSLASVVLPQRRKAKITCELSNSEVARPRCFEHPTFAFGGKSPSILAETFKLVVLVYATTAAFRAVFPS
jgi:hypothetical protein